MDPALSVALIIGLAALTQSISGSGSALVAMPLLIGILAPVPAASLVSLVAISIQVIMLARYRRNLHPSDLWRLILSAVIGIPIGIELLSTLDEKLILTFLGILLISYSGYSLIGPSLPEIRSRIWDFAFGFASGLLGGAYNTGGPPFVIYGIGRRWDSTTFKANLQILLMVNAILVTLNHLVRGHYTSEVMTYYALSLPALVIMTLMGFWLERYVSAAIFRRIILVLLLLVGIRMLIL